MERIRKVRELLRSKWHAFLKDHWHNVPSDDYFRSVDVAFQLAGMVFTATNRWERICWRFYRCLVVYDYLILMLDAVDHLYHRTDFFSTVWPLMKFFAMTMAVVRDAIFWRHYEAIALSRDFINGKRTTSGDADYDYNLRKKYFQRTQVICFVMHGAIASLVILGSILISPDDKLFGLPRSMLGMYPWAVKTAHYLYITTLFIIWVNRNCAPPVLASALLDGYKTELRIVERGIANLSENVPWDILEQLKATEDPADQSRKANNDRKPVGSPNVEAHRALLDEFWIDLKQRVRIIVEQHVKLLENLQQLQPCVEELFLAVYYTALIMFGALIYAPVAEGISKGTAVGLVGLTAYFAECFWWCNLVESLQDVNESIELRILEFVVKIPQTPEHHSDYVQMRSTLMIVKMNVGHSAQFGCYEIFTISNELFCELINTAYTVLTFLLNMDLDR